MVRRQGIADGVGNSVRPGIAADVGARIRSLRTARGLTQAQLAEPNYTKAYVSMLESGRTRASMKALEHIAGALGVQPSDLLGGRAAPDAPHYDLLEARRLIEQAKWGEATAILERLDEGLAPADQLVRLRYLAVAHNRAGRPKQAFPIIERAQKMADLLGDKAEQTRIMSVLANAYLRTYAYDEGVKLLRECVAACDSGVLNDPPFLFRRLVDLGAAYGTMKQPKLALATFERAMQVGEQFALRRSLGAVYAGMADGYRQTGDLELAIRYSQRSLDIYEELGLLDRAACMLDTAALLYAESGNRERARECLARAALLAEQTQSDRTLATIQVSQAEVQAKTDPEQALEAAQSALKFARKADNVEAQVRALVIVGELKLGSAPATARRSFGDARALAEERAPHLLRLVYDRWSHAAEAAGDGEEALRLARRALDTMIV